MDFVEQLERAWRLCAGGLELDVDRKTGCLSRLVLRRDKKHVWTAHAGDVTVRDDRLERIFGCRHLTKVDFSPKGDTLVIRKAFHGAPWVLEETYRPDGGALAWDAALALESGEYRSCEISYHLPWPLPLYPMCFWAAKGNMPSAPHRFAGIALEYGEVTSGILIPALCCYRQDPQMGLLLAMPFDFHTPRFRFISGYRDPDLQVSFDWLALAPGKPARAKFFLRGCEPGWRPALGWLYERYKEYFEPRSKLIHSLWGGHILGRFDDSVREARKMVALGLKWHELHGHFPAYGNYHPEGVTSWRSRHFRRSRVLITVDTIRRTIRNLHEAGAATLLYMQLSGDADKKLWDSKFRGDRVRDWYGNLWSAWPGAYLMNSDLSLAFGEDIARQIDGMVERYPEMDGVFVDQPCYNFLDTAHSDGITAVNNRPCYMTALNFEPHLEHLSRLVHPGKAIIGNGPCAIWQMKYIDGFMAEAMDWLCDQMQYYGIGSKPMYFLEYNTSDQRLEQMFQKCLLYGAGFTSFPAAMPSKDLFDLYLPVLQRLYCRRWVFDLEPLRAPASFQGSVFRGRGGSLLVSVISTMARLPGRGPRDRTLCVRTRGVERAVRVTLQQPGGAVESIPFHRGGDGVQFDVPASTVAAVAELEFRNREE